MAKSFFGSVWAAVNRPLSMGRSASPSSADEARIASKGKRDTFIRLLPTLPNPDPTLLKFSPSRDGIYLYDKIIQQFAFVGGYMAQWIDRVLVTDRCIKPACVDDPSLTEEQRAAQQAIADRAAARASRAWKRVRNASIVLQKLLTARFFGFARAEKVWRLDPIVKEWIPELYDVPQRAWGFDDDGNDFLFTTTDYIGKKVDSSKFIHLQWGSADTKYGAGILSEIYLALWFIQQIQEFGLAAVEDYSKLIAIVHIPRSFEKKERTDAIAAAKDQYRYVVTSPTDAETMSIELPSQNVTANGTAGRQEYEVIRFYERWIQIRMLGAPQTQDKGGSGNGKLDEIRSDIWDDKTPYGSQAIDQVLTEQWLYDYMAMNLADVPVELWPRFESDPEIDQALSAGQVTAVVDICTKLVAQQITAEVAIELIAGVGVPRQRAKSMVEGTMKQLANLKPVAPAPIAAPPMPPQDKQPTDQPAAKIAIAMENGTVLEFTRGTMVLTDKGEIPAEMLHAASGAAIVTMKSAPATEAA
jgi:hypothetical protein